MKGGLPQQSWLTKQVHISWHIAVASLGILIGVAGAPVFAQQFTSVSWLIIAASLMLTVSIRRARYLLIVALLAGLTVGLWRGSGEFSALQEIRPFIGKTVIVKGTVTEDTTYGSKGDQRFRIGAAVINQQKLACVI